MITFRIIIIRFGDDKPLRCAFSPPAGHVLHSTIQSVIDAATNELINSPSDAVLGAVFFKKVIGSGERTHPMGFW